KLFTARHAIGCELKTFCAIEIVFSGAPGQPTPIAWKGSVFGPLSHTSKIPGASQSRSPVVPVLTSSVVEPVVVPLDVEPVVSLVAVVVVPLDDVSGAVVVGAPVVGSPVVVVVPVVGPVVGPVVELAIIDVEPPPDV